MCQAAVYVLLRRDGEAPFVMREHTGYMDGYYCLPAGRVEPDEPYTQAAIREAYEEVGVKIDSESLRFLYAQNRKSEDGKYWIDIFFEAIDWRGEPYNAEPEKHSSVVWFNLNNVPNKVMDYQKAALERIRHGVSYGEFGWD